MLPRKENVIMKKADAFSDRVLKLYKFLTEEKHEMIISKQILRSGTSIGANVFESRNAQGGKDFINKLNIALKESDETDYWLELLFLTDYLNQESYDSLVSDNKYITAVLTNIIKSCKNAEDNHMEE